MVEHWSVTGELFMSCAPLIVGQVTTLWVNCPAVGQPTRTTQPFILPRSINEYFSNPCKKWVTEANGRWRGRGVVYRRRHGVFQAARLECMLAAGSRPLKQR